MTDLKRLTAMGMALALACLCPIDLRAKDHFLTLGGGYDATSNQISLEKNVLFLQRVLDSTYTNKPAHDIFFAAGNDDHRTVQYRLADFATKCPPARRMMSEIFGDRADMDLAYRQHQISDVSGPAELKVIRRRFDELGKKLTSGDRLFVYATGHGGPSEASFEAYDFGYYDDPYASDEPQQNPYNTTLQFWGDDSITAREFTHLLDRLPADVPVILVMVQCYAGGFSHAIFLEGDSDLGLSDRPRCGFFAQLHDREAAGCTPDIHEADYQEFSSFFWAALAGENRTGEPVTSADYDQNGEVSLAEAYAYAVLESNTIDVPVRTSDAFLRKYSHLGNDPELAEDGEGSGGLFGIFGKENRPDAPELIRLTGPVANFITHARPEQRVILQQMPNKMGMSASLSVDDLQAQIEELKQQLSRLETKVMATSQVFEQTRQRIQKEVRKVWPELHAEYSPLSMQLANEQSEEFVSQVESMPAYHALSRAYDRMETSSDNWLDAGRQEAKALRLLRTCENIVLSVNLPQVATEDVVERYNQLVSLEEGFINR